jgi:hypothetical protein
MRRLSEPLSRRELIKTFGLSALLLHPVLRSMAYAAPTPFASAPRFIMFFKGGAFVPKRTDPPAIDNLAGTPIAPLQAHAKDIVLFKGMNIHGGSPKTNGYQEEHAGGLYGCVTGDRYKYFKNDAYFAYTDAESIDIHIADNYKKRPELKDLPLASLHLGGGAHSDADSTGHGNRFISFRKRQPGQNSYWANAVEPIQDSGQVYDLLMRSASRACVAGSNQPRSDAQKLNAALSVESETGVVDVVHKGLQDAKRQFGMDSEHARKLDGLIESWSASEKAARKEPAVIQASAPVKARACSPGPRPSGDGANKHNLDTLSPVHDQMIAMLKLAFEMDITRVAAFTLSGASSGQTWPSRGIRKPHHDLEHSGDVEALVKIDTYYSEKFAALLAALKSIDDGGGKSALHNSSIILGMECWSTGGHHMTNIPFLLAGQGGGRFKTGRIVQAGGRNNNDLLISCLQASGIETSTFGLASLCKGPIV